MRHKQKGTEICSQWYNEEEEEAVMNEEYSLKCHEMAKQLMRELRVVEHVMRSYRETDDRIREYGKYYLQAYEVFYTLGKRQAGG